MKTSAWKKECLVAVMAAIFLGLLLTFAGHQFAPAAMSADGRIVYSDDFERTAVGDAYRQGTPDPGHTTKAWRLESFCRFSPDAPDQAPKKQTFELFAHGIETIPLEIYCDRKLVGEGIHNAALWLQNELPDSVRVEFNAVALTDSGDVRAEIFGDGITHQSGYILIMGGWSNQMNIIARQDEHGEDRKRDARCLIRDRRRVCVEKNQPHRWGIERRNNVVRWYIDGKLFMRYPDTYPLRGSFFGFNNWEAKVAFDDLKIFDLR